MANDAQDISGLVASIVVNLLDYPEDLSVSASDEEDGSIYVEIHVNEEDAGHVIGRQGRIIKAIRTLARAASKDGRPVEVEIVD